MYLYTGTMYYRRGTAVSTYVWWTCSSRVRTVLPQSSAASEIVPVRHVPVTGGIYNSYTGIPGIHGITVEQTGSLP